MKKENNTKDNYEFRPRINPESAERVQKLGNDFKLSSQKLVNFFVNIGCECMERSLPVLEDSIKKKFTNILNDIQKK
jgi:hypothetical protein